VEEAHAILLSYSYDLRRLALEMIFFSSLCGAFRSFQALAETGCIWISVVCTGIGSLAILGKSKSIIYPFKILLRSCFQVLKRLRDFLKYILDSPAANRRRQGQTLHIDMQRKQFFFAQKIDRIVIYGTPSSCHLQEGQSRH